jgi:large subunit ribosomal protein L29
MKAEQLEKFSHLELTEKLAEAKEELFNLRFQLATNQLDNTARLTQVRRDVARIRTIMRRQEIAAWREEQKEEG